MNTFFLCSFFRLLYDNCVSYFKKFCLTFWRNFCGFLILLFKFMGSWTFRHDCGLVNLGVFKQIDVVNSKLRNFEIFGIGKKFFFNWIAKSWIKKSSNLISFKKWFEDQHNILLFEDLNFLRESFILFACNTKLYGNYFMFI